MKNKRNPIIIQIINILYFLIIIFFNNNFDFLNTINAKVVSFLVGILLSLFSMLYIVRDKTNYKRLFLLINTSLILIYLYEVYFYLAIDNS